MTFILDGEVVSPEFGAGSGLRPTTTVLEYLRARPDRRGTKEGCAEGDCGACTVVLGEPGGDGRLRYRAVDSCLVFLPMLHGRQLVTVENLRDGRGALHPVQRAMVDHHGSQCGFCTPGIVMTLFALYHSRSAWTREEATRALSGNLCRCTGYRSILDAAMEAQALAPADEFDADEPRVLARLGAIPDGSLELEAFGQRYRRPATLAEALAMRREVPDAVLVSGATDVALRVTKGYETLAEVLDLSGVAELRAFESTAEGCVIGAGLPLADLLPRVTESHPALAEMIRWFGSGQIRNLATLGGNLGTASPIGDTLPVLIACGARVRVAGPAGMREVTVEAFLTGYRTNACRADELIAAVVLPRAGAGEVVRAYKISRRRELDISTVTGAFRLARDPGGTVREVVLAFGGMAETARRAPRAEAALLGRPWTRAGVEQAMARVDEDFSPISDTRGGAEARRLVARNLLLRFWSDTAGEGAPAGVGATR